MFMTNLIDRLWRKNTKWHEVEWRDGSRTIWMALRFAPEPQPEADSSAAESPARPPLLEVLPVEGKDAGTISDGPQTITEVETAVDEYNKMNLCALRVVGIRRHATTAAQAVDYGTAARKLLNLL
jgi:hypothetical protein